MNETQIFMIAAMQIAGIAMALYILYLFGGISQNVKKIVEKLEQIEKKLGSS
jgi:hypothetical protein